MKKLLIGTWMLSAIVFTVSFINIVDAREREPRDRTHTRPELSITVENITNIALEALQTAFVDVVVQQTNGSDSARVETTHDIPSEWNPLWMTRRGLKETNTCILRSGACASKLQFTAPDEFNEEEFVVTATVRRQGTPTIERFKVAPVDVVERGSFTIELDPLSPPYMQVLGGATGITLGKLLVSASNEAIRLGSLALELTDNGMSSPSDILLVYIYDDATLVGTGLFLGTNREITIFFTQNVTVPKDGSKVLAIKGDLAPIGPGQPGTDGTLIQVNYDGDHNENTVGVGVGSGAEIRPDSSDTNVAGVQMFESIP